MYYAKYKWDKKWKEWKYGWISSVYKKVNKDNCNPHGLTQIIEK